MPLRPTSEEYRKRHDLVHSYLDYAEVDAQVAELLAKTAFRAHAAYCLSQCAEKTVKAVMYAEGVHRGDVGHHQIGQLASLLPEANPLRDDLQALDFMTGWATTFRYPSPGSRGERPAPSERDLLDYVATLRARLLDAKHECDHLLTTWKDGT